MNQKLGFEEFLAQLPIKFHDRPENVFTRLFFFFMLFWSYEMFFFHLMLL